MEEYQLGDWSSGKKHKAEMTLNVRPLTPTEHPIMIERMFSPEGMVFSPQTAEVQMTTMDVVVTDSGVTSVTTRSAANVDTVFYPLDETTTTEEPANANASDNDVPNVINTSDMTMSRAVSSVPKDELIKVLEAIICLLSSIVKYFTA